MSPGGRSGSSCLTMPEYKAASAAPQAGSTKTLAINKQIRPPLLVQRCNGTMYMGWVIWKYWNCPFKFFYLGSWLLSALSTPNGGRRIQCLHWLKPKNNRINITAQLHPSFNTTSSWQKHKQTPTEILYVSIFSSSTSILYLYLHLCEIDVQKEWHGTPNIFKNKQWLSRLICLYSNDNNYKIAQANMLMLPLPSILH